MTWHVRSTAKVQRKWKGNKLNHPVTETILRAELEDSFSTTLNKYSKRKSIVFVI